MTADDIRSKLRGFFTVMSMREWCRLKEVNVGHLSEFMLGKKENPPSDVLRALNLRVDYVRNNSQTVGKK